MLDDLLDYWRGSQSPTALQRRPEPSRPVDSDYDLMANIRRTYGDFAMEIAPLLFDLGKPKPTTRQIADLVKAGGAEALTEAIRRADAARYQEVRCRSALNP